MLYAIFDMSREGWIYRIPSRGTFVKGIPETYIPRSKSVPVQSPTTNRGVRPKIGLIYKRTKETDLWLAAEVSFFACIFLLKTLK
ncbi:DNA-binding GntR family transcriptional regulator [Paenibacillus sp. V4I3]|uniref:hypothetical protein n=1 Tax=unclassified Paenibacillus TaxID=185978 RepID=UPI00278158B7|nr:MULTISPECIES: hypothetical protein [unclassified Paenibacillus]MDQ0871695.1 DNA-binding GntR family transcriptional regulator [Paenibacillus sp. V4I3]MDQ0892419.1 DNA-binding GntR family transcriptional regulator [Paenibacillus sp. V4I9]